jgi:hypothetical protein
VTTPASPVTAVSGFTILGTPSTSPQLVTIYTVQSGGPERIESVYMTIVPDTGATNNTVYGIQLVDQSGVVLYLQTTPIFTPAAGVSAVEYLTFSRLGNDSAQEPVAVQDSASDAVFYYSVNMRLPDLVLQNGSMVNFAIWRDDGGEGSDTLVSDCSITVTRNPGPVSDTTSVADILPLLVPTTG